MDRAAGFYPVGWGFESLRGHRAQPLRSPSPWRFAVDFVRPLAGRPRVKVLAVSNAAWPAIGGIEVLLDQLLPALASRGHALTLLTGAHHGANEPVAERHGLVVHRTQLVAALARRDPGMLSRERQRVKRLVDDVRPELIHAHDPGPNLWAVLKARPVAPVLMTLHVGIQSAGGGASLASIAELLRASAWVTAVSNEALAEALAIEPSLTGRTSLIANGIPRLAGGPFDVVPGRVVCVGRLVEQKGFDLALRAMARVVDARPTAHLVVAGDGPEQSALVALAAELGLSHRVTFVGAVKHDDVRRLLGSAQVVLMPSRWEGQPLVALEAASVGRPVLSSPVGGLPTVVVDGVTGIVAIDLDPATFAGHLHVLLDDDALCDALGANARAQLGDRHGLERCVDAYDDLYRRLVARPRDGVSPVREPHGRDSVDG
jgi:glycogen synthase